MKFRIRLLSQLTLLAVVLFPLAAWSQPAPREEPPAQSRQEALEPWQKMTPEERQELRERYQRW
ncbi:MAG: hypothetical protein WCH75_12240, partial [Candidatus Binatia bacterium]